ncbi:uncharacterized protein LOC114439606 [Parambassis ranga]|uniref:Uncharacterized protein LOC114439606 n=1 Tax=Parambassis ranga TaxID=210632 RepID=A0A6P7IUG5_9TELE|nr:uncharacterized protein LOC114439606 [Parambassis ranga]
MGKTANLTTGQKTIIDTLHRMVRRLAVYKVPCPCISMESLVEGQNVAGEHAPAQEMTVGFSGLSNRILSESTRKSGMRQESPQSNTTTFRHIKEMGYNQGEEGLDCWPVAKILFSDESKVCLSFGNQGPRVWRKTGSPQKPVNSPDLNPIENLWGTLKGKIRDTRPKIKKELTSSIKDIWASITPKQCHKLIASMALIKAKGFPTKY